MMNTLIIWAAVGFSGTAVLHANIIQANYTSGTAKQFSNLGQRSQNSCQLNPAILLQSL
jgi:hypothetical protein